MSARTEDAFATIHIHYSNVLRDFKIIKLAKALGLQGTECKRLVFKVSMLANQRR